MAYPPAQQPEEFLDDNGNPVTLDDNGNIIGSQIQALDDSGSVIESAKQFGAGVLDVGKSLVQMFNPIGEPTENDPLSQRLGFSLQNPARRMAEGMISSTKGSVEDIGEGDYLRAAAGLGDIVGLPATGVVDLTREGNYSRAAGTGTAGLGLAYLGGKAGRGAKLKSEVKIPEVLPPEKPVIRGLLEAPKDPYIVGESGRTQKRSLITPQEEARLAGYDIDADGNPIGTKGESVGSVVDLGELRERARQEALTYTNRDLEGGTPLVIERQPNVEIPAGRWSERQSFEPFAQQENLEYPLNVVPSAVTPRRTQTVMEALVPERFNEPIPLEPEPLKPVSAKPEVPLTQAQVRDTLGGTAAIEPGEPILPSAVRRSQRKVREVTGLEPPKTKAPTPDTEINKAVQESVKKLSKQAEEPSILLSSVYRQLEELGPAGKNIVQRAQRAAQKSSEYDAVWTEPLFDVGKRLSKSEAENFGYFVENPDKIPNQRVRKAVEEWDRLQNMMGDVAIANKLHLKRGENVVPFEKVSKNYWPRIPKEGLEKTDIIDRLVKNGMSRTDAINVSKRWEATGEIFLGAQHSRMKELFPYETNFDSAIQHGRAMSRRIANHAEFGPKDTAGKGVDGIADLIEATSDPKLAVKLAQRLVGRGERPNKDLVNGLNRARRFVTMAKLPNFGLPNIQLGQTMNAYMASISNHPYKAVKEITNLIKSSYRDEVRAAGVFNSFNRSLLEEMGRIGRIDWFGIGTGEKINRSIAAAIGRSTAREAFIDYKSGVNTASARQWLETLLSRDPDTITEWTPELERFAAGRMSEISQASNNPGNMPYAWSEPVNSYKQVAIQLGLIFKKVAFQTTKTVKDSIMNQPTPAKKAKAALAWMALTQIGGEMVGDTKSLITGRERPEELIERIASNWGQAFMLGLPWDLATSAQYGPLGLVGSVVGAAYTTGSELGYAGWNTGKNFYNDKEDPFKPMRNFMYKNLPIPGRERIKTAVEE